ncbi:hypothetical protein BK731_17045 [Bacillus thuringiensis serovar muju]|nr:hypothetical protein [Bacillus thuringiensis]OTY05363.1 hypothetical protein BK731_17045 [Bacillus thuringiensis serovar muju]QDQ06115.1 hypothetical protein EKQ63_13810 [Bacillus sp. BD59S]
MYIFEKQNLFFVYTTRCIWSFIDLFCVRHNYERIPHSFCKDVISDIVIDLDNDYIYLPN